MAASKSTVERVLEVILKHVPKETALKILEELMTVPGNKSFRDTIERMYNRARQRSSRRSPRRPPVAPEPPATVRNTADGEEAHQGARRRHENSGFGAKPGLPIHTTIPRSLAEVTASGKVHPLREVGLLEMSGIRNITHLKGRRVGVQATG